MRIIIVILIILATVSYSRRKKAGGASPSKYKNCVKKLLKQFEDGQISSETALGEIREMAAMENVQKYFRKTYGKMCSFANNEMVLESYFLLVFGDMRTHYVYRKSPKKEKGFESAYEDYYIGNKNYNMIVSDKYLYFGDDLNQKKGKRPVKIPLSKILWVEKTTDYIEFHVKTRLRGERIHNVWCSSGDGAYYLVSALCGFEINKKLIS